VKIPLVDLVAQYHALQPEVDDAVRGVLESGQFILGPQVEAFEREMAAYLSVEHAVGVGSGTDALVLALRALGIGPEDEVIVPTYTFFATAEAVMLVGAVPVLVDMDGDTYGIDVAQARARLSPRTKAVIPVHLFGHPVDMQPLQAWAREHGLKVVEDNAQAIGAEYRGLRTGGLGDVGCLSFFPSKNLGAYGDAGMVVTSDAEVAERVRMLRTHGWRKKYSPEMTGYNSRLDELQAAILRVKLRHLDRWNERRRALATRYSARLDSIGVVVPGEASWARHVYHHYVVRVARRDAVQRQLADEGIATGVYYPAPLHRTAPCRTLPEAQRDFPIADRAAQESLAIPLYPELPEDYTEHVIKVFERAITALRL
jgi:dTDP-4-amino-4,6-dideoxygalactose transaminase